MTSSTYDSYRPPEEPRKKKRRRFTGATGEHSQLGGIKAKLSRSGAGARTASDGSREMPMVAEAEFTSYYGRPVIKPPPWGHEIATYMFLGGVAGGSSLLALGADVTGRESLRRNTRITALAATGIGAIALIYDLGRPERFLNMMRTFKVTSPMNLGSWILGAFGTSAGVAAAAEVERLLTPHVPLLQRKLFELLRAVLYRVERPAGIAAAVCATPLASYTAVLLSDTANPTWNALKDHLPFVFVSSASLAAGGVAMLTTNPRHTVPARIMACLGVAGEVAAMRMAHKAVHPVIAESLSVGAPGKQLKWAERLTIAGGIGAAVLGKWRPAACVAGGVLAAASALTRFGILEAGIHSAKDPKYTIEPQKARLAERRRRGIVDDSITTV